MLVQKGTRANSQAMHQGVRCGCACSRASQAQPGCSLWLAFGSKHSHSSVYESQWLCLLPSADIGTYDCDADLDGWVRESARISLTANDPVLRASANCSLRSINQIILENEYGESKTVDLDRPVPLYESVRNDDDGLLRATWLSYGLPNYESGRLVAANLNRFTKACHALNVDYNDNGAPTPNQFQRIHYIIFGFII